MTGYTRTYYLNKCKHQCTNFNPIWSIIIISSFGPLRHPAYSVVSYNRLVWVHWYWCIGVSRCTENDIWSKEIIYSWWYNSNPQVRDSGTCSIRNIFDWIGTIKCLFIVKKYENLPADIFWDFPKNRFFDFKSQIKILKNVCLCT